MLRLGLTVIGVTDLDRAAAFWSSAVGLSVSEEWSSPTWRTMVRPDGSRVLGLMVSTSPPEPRRTGTSDDFPALPQSTSSQNSRP